MHTLGASLQNKLPVILGASYVIVKKWSFGFFKKKKKWRFGIPFSMGAHQYDPKDGWVSFVVSRFFVVNSHMKLEKYCKHNI